MRPPSQSTRTAPRPHEEPDPGVEDAEHADERAVAPHELLVGLVEARQLVGLLHVGLAPPARPRGSPARGPSCSRAAPGPPRSGRGSCRPKWRTRNDTRTSGRSASAEQRGLITSIRATVPTHVARVFAVYMIPGPEHHAHRRHVVGRAAHDVADALGLVVAGSSSVRWRKTSFRSSYSISRLTPMRTHPHVVAEDPLQQDQADEERPSTAAASPG